MTITTDRLTRAAGVSAVLAGLLFIGVQLNHPHLDTTSITTTEVQLRNGLKILMAAFGLAGITGMYVSQVRRNGVLGLVGYLLLSVGYLVIAGTCYMAAFVLPHVAGADPSFVSDVIAATTGKTPDGDLGALGVVLKVQDASYLAGGLVFGIALFRAGVLARWATVLLAVGGVVTVALAVMPDAFYRLLAFPNGIAMVALGWSLWHTARRDAAVEPVAVAA
jgi:hypothetical protein